MRILVLLITTSLFLMACEDKKIDIYDIAKIIEDDNLKLFKKKTATIKLDTCNFDDGRTALHYAIGMKSSKIAKHLIDEDFMINQIDSFGSTPLLSAIVIDQKIKSSGNTDFLSDREIAIKGIIAKILEKKTAINTIDKNGLAAIHYAVYGNDINLIKKLLLKNADVNLKSEYVMDATPLHAAVENDNDSVVKLLLENKALDTIKNVNGHTAIYLATRSKNSNILKLFFNKMDKDQKKELFNNTVRNSGNPDFLKEILKEKWVSKKLINDAFVFSKTPSISNVLLKKGANMKYLHSKYNYGAIHYAAMRGDTIMIDFLLKKGVNINQLAKNKSISPLMYAAQLNGTLGDLSKQTAKLQIGINEMFYDISGKSNEKNAENSMESVKFLLKNKANINFSNSNNENALYYANASFNNDVAKYLKQAGSKETKVFKESIHDRNRRIMNSIY